MKTLRSQWVGIAIAMLALFVAIGGPAMASNGARAAVKLITGKQIKDGSIAAKDLSPAARRALKGKRGPAGPSGSIQGAAAGGDLTGSYPDPELAPGTVGVAEQGVVPAVRVTGSSTAVPDDTVTTLNWGSSTAYESVSSMFDETTGQRFVAPVDGLYLAHASVGFSGNANGVRTVSIAINGSNSNPACFDRDAAAAATLATFVNATCVIDLDAGEFVTTTVTQTSGGSLALNGFESATLTWIAPKP